MRSLTSVDHAKVLGPAGNNMVRGLKGFGTAGAVVSGGTTFLALHSYYMSGGINRGVYIKGVMDMTMAGVSLMGLPGFAVSSAYFLIDAGTGGFGGYGAIPPSFR